MKTYVVMFGSLVVFLFPVIAVVYLLGKSWVDGRRANSGVGKGAAHRTERLAEKRVAA